MDKKILEVQNLTKYFNLSKNNILHAVENISFDLYERETLGIVGESGCGKTTLGRTVLGLYDCTKGKVLFEGKEVHKLNKIEKKEFKQKAQIILQDPYSSLNPRMTVRDIIAEGIEAHKLLKRKEIDERVKELLGLVGLDAQYMHRYPHEFSGGQRQRIGIARTLAVNPKFIVCDEPISALDVSIQAQIVNLFNKLQKEFGLTYLFIAHDLSMVRHISDRVGVMYLGHLVEIGKCEDIYINPKHPYTQALLSAIPSTDIENPMKNRRIKLTGEVSSPINTKKGCLFAERCQMKKQICTEETPQLKEVEKNHYVACHCLI